MLTNVLILLAPIAALGLLYVAIVWGDTGRHLDGLLIPEPDGECGCRWFIGHEQPVCAPCHDHEDPGQPAPHFNQWEQELTRHPPRAG
jgi:hypothetical protein